jgi:NAD(P)-dependent dehydrogenase (short-subunit alcohol dehydrogenase family)
MYELYVRHTDFVHQDVGYAVAKLCLKHSMRVSILDFNQSTLDLASASLKGEVKCLKADVGSREDWTRIRKEVGDVDFLMLNAGVTGKGSWGDEEYFDKILHTNLNGVINGLNAYVPSFMAKEGKERARLLLREVNRVLRIHLVTWHTTLAKRLSKHSQSI